MHTSHTHLSIIIINNKMQKLLLLLLCSSCHYVLSFTDGLLPNGNFESGPKKSDLKGTVVTSPTAIPEWEILGYIEYIKSGQKQKDMLLVVPEGDYAVRLGNNGAIKQKVTNLVTGNFYSITFSGARTCAQDEKLNVSVSPNVEPNDWGLLPMQTIYSSNGWDSYSWAFRADAPEVEISIHNLGDGEDPACGPLVDAVALKALTLPKRTRDNVLRNANFEEGPYMFPNASWGVIVPPHTEEDHSPIPAWIVESLKAVKYIDSNHFTVPSGSRAVELVGGKESAISQVAFTIPNKVYVITFSVGDAGDSCIGSMAVEAYAGKDSVKVTYASNRKGSFVRGKLRFTAVSTRTRVTFLSSFYSTTADGSLCGPVIDDMKMLSVRS